MWFHFVFRVVCPVFCSVHCNDCPFLVGGCRLLSSVWCASYWAILPRIQGVCSIVVRLVLSF